MIQKFPENDSTAIKLARLIYKAIVRYAKAKKSLTGDKNPRLRLDVSRVWRGNVKETFDRLEK